MTKVSDWIRHRRSTKCSAVIVAAGSSSRMGKDKLYQELKGVPVLVRTVRAIGHCDCVSEIVVVVRADMLEQTAAIFQQYGVPKVAKIVVGGSNRCESSLAGLSEIRRDAKLVMIHDGARPFVTEKLVADAVHGAMLYRCAAPAVPVTDTVKERDGDAVIRTLDRSSLAAMQTPQVFVPELIKTALTQAVRTGTEYTDDCAAVEAMGFSVHLTEGDAENIKLTRPMDMTVAEAILDGRH